MKIRREKCKNVVNLWKFFGSLCFTRPFLTAFWPCERSWFEGKIGFKFERKLTNINIGRTSNHTGRRKTLFLCRQSKIQCDFYLFIVSITVYIAKPIKTIRSATQKTPHGYKFLGKNPNPILITKMTTGCKCTPISTKTLITFGPLNQFLRLLSYFVEKCLFLFCREMFINAL